MQRTEPEPPARDRTGMILSLARLARVTCWDVVSSAGQSLRLLAAELRKFG